MADPLPLWLVGLAAAFAFPLAACGGDTTCDDCGSSSTTSSASCTSTFGTLHGDVTGLFGGPEPRAIVELRQAPGDTPLLAKADDTASYSVELDAGSWIVTGASEDGYCTPTMPGNVELAPCADVAYNLVLDVCFL